MIDKRINKSLLWFAFATLRLFVIIESSDLDSSLVSLAQNDNVGFVIARWIVDSPKQSISAIRETKANRLFLCESKCNYLLIRFCVINFLYLLDSRDLDCFGFFKASQWRKFYANYKAIAMTNQAHDSAYSFTISFNFSTTFTIAKVSNLQYSKSAVR